MRAASASGGHALMLQRAGWHRHLGHDFGNDAVSGQSFRQRLIGQHDPMAQHIAKIVPFYHKFYQRYDLDGIFVHDPETIAYLVDPSLFTVASYPLRVDTSPGISRGKTWPDMNKKLRPEWAILARGDLEVVACTSRVEKLDFESAIERCHEGLNLLLGLLRRDDDLEVILRAYGVLQRILGILFLLWRLCETLRDSAREIVVWRHS